MAPDEIKQARKKLKLSQKAFADVLGVSFATVNRWERGHADPQADRLARIKDLIENRSPNQEVSDLDTARPAPQVAIDFEGSAEHLKLVVDAYRLRPRQPPCLPGPAAPEVVTSSRMAWSTRVDWL